MSVKLLTEHHLELSSLKGDCTGSSESTLVKMSKCSKSHTAAQLSQYCKLRLSKLSNCKVLSIVREGNRLATQI